MESLNLQVQPGGDAVLSLAGEWTKKTQNTSIEKLLQQISSLKRGATLRFKSGQLTEWDTTLLTFISELKTRCDNQGVKLDYSSLPDGAIRLLRLAAAVPERGGSHAEPEHVGLCRMVGTQAAYFCEQVLVMLRFLGEAAFGLTRLLRGKSRMRWREFFVVMEDCGPSALPIVTLIGVLVGLILAYIGAVQLEKFGAEIYVANLVGIAMAREMGAVMAGIILAGRTGASFAAQLGTMQVNEEIDALTTMGISPMESLVVPRMIALMLMMPLLCVFADLMGILGGAIVSTIAFDITLIQFFEQVKSSLQLRDIIVGLVKSVVFGMLVAIAGCLCGMRSGRSASAVGEAVTSAVVYGIVSIVIADAIFAIVTSILDV